MAILGFIALFLLGCFLILSGLAGAYPSVGFSGRADWFCLVPVIVGVALVWLAIHFSPLQITLKP